jgi:hypothetical protein
MAKRDEYDAAPSEQTWTPDRVARFTDPDQVRFVLEQMASGDLPVSDALRFKALETLATLTGLGIPEPAEIEDDADRPDTAKMTDAELVEWLRAKYARKGE